MKIPSCSVQAMAFGHASLRYALTVPVPARAGVLTVSARGRVKHSPASGGSLRGVAWGRRFCQGKASAAGPSPRALRSLGASGAGFAVASGGAGYVVEIIRELPFVT